MISQERVRFFVSAFAVVGVTAIVGNGVAAQAQAVVHAEIDSAPVTAALDELDQWLGSGPNGDRWRAYLGTKVLRAELATGTAADPRTIARSLQRLSSGAKGLDLPQFVRLRRTLASYLLALQFQRDDDVSPLTWNAEAERAPISPKEFSALRAEMRAKARTLEKALGDDSPLVRNWKTFLKWEQLEDHLDDDYQATRRSLNQLDETLRRFHANEPGLELPVFSEAAQAIAKYRAVASWAVAAQTRDLRADYERLLASLGDELKRHVDRPTAETSWKVGRIMGVVDDLGQAGDFVHALRGRLAQKNILASASIDFVRRLPRQRTVNQVRPVRDCILGTNIFGSACTLGAVRYDLLPSDDAVELAVHLEGKADSTTNGYNGPVRIDSLGLTTFRASKRISISDDAFTASPAIAAADTRTRITSINKLGGRLGGRLIEKIAWKRALQQKRLAERISAQHAQRRVASELDERIADELKEARERYQTKVRDPLIRRGVVPEHVRMSSTEAELFVEATFATRRQLGAYNVPPRPNADNDLSLQIHDSAVNNYLPLALASARISQDEADEPPRLEGDIPPWLKKLAASRPRQADDAKRLSDKEGERAAGEAERPDRAVEPKVPPFKPYSIVLNGEAPVGVRFEHGKVVIRIRAAQLLSDDAEYNNWDFIITYAVSQAGQGIVLKRVGEIEVFPTGFDPQWDKQLTAQQSGFRSTLAKNMNARANAGQSFPATIDIDPIQIESIGELTINQLQVEDGWLTIGWKLPPL